MLIGEDFSLVYIKARSRQSIHGATDCGYRVFQKRERDRIRKNSTRVWQWGGIANEVEQRAGEKRPPTVVTAPRSTLEDFAKIRRKG